MKRITESSFIDHTGPQHPERRSRRRVERIGEGIEGSYGKMNRIGDKTEDRGQRQRNRVVWKDKYRGNREMERKTER